MKTTIHLGARTSAATHEIVKLEAQDNYTLVHFIDGTKLLSSTTLGILEERLSDCRFFRVNRSTVINLQYLRQFNIHPYGHRQNTKSTHDIIISRRRAAAFQACVKA
ncbi:LytTR family DNA-binding domain-containing protein [uncultured Arcticibacterium sp.]|uniref:LytR/AlgR family response regulator transcription factor n=1 Tax=uncultured Arcticibacterium sp. TaxID=2173042 RepID=UPI0030F61BFC